MESKILIKHLLAWQIKLITDGFEHFATNAHSQTSHNHNYTSCIVLEHYSSHRHTWTSKTHKHPYTLCTHATDDMHAETDHLINSEGKSKIISISTQTHDKRTNTWLFEICRRRKLVHRKYMYLSTTTTYIIYACIESSAIAIDLDGIYWILLCFCAALNASNYIVLNKFVLIQLPKELIIYD